MDVTLEVDGRPDFRESELTRAKLTLVIGGAKVTLRVRPTRQGSIGGVRGEENLGVSELTMELATMDRNLGQHRVQSRVQAVIPVAE